MKRANRDTAVMPMTPVMRGGPFWGCEPTLSHQIFRLARYTLFCPPMTSFRTTLPLARTAWPYKVQPEEAMETSACVPSYCAMSWGSWTMAGCKWRLSPYYNVITVVLELCGSSYLCPLSPILYLLTQLLFSLNIWIFPERWITRKCWAI